MKSYGSSFTATNASWTKTKTCTTTDGKTVAITKGRYSGAASGDPDLAGPIRLAAHSVINTTDGVGFVDGRLRIDVPGRDTVANFTAVYDHGALAGFARGHARTPHARLLANISDGFSSGGASLTGSSATPRAAPRSRSGPVPVCRSRGSRRARQGERSQRFRRGRSPSGEAGATNRLCSAFSSSRAT
jgi:hypothetical protein